MPLKEIYKEENLSVASLIKMLREKKDFVLFITEEWCNVCEETFKQLKKTLAVSLFKINKEKIAAIIPELEIILHNTLPITLIIKNGKVKTTVLGTFNEGFLEEIQNAL